MKVNKVEEYSLYQNMSQEFLNAFDAIITESDDNKSLMHKTLDDLKINTELVMTFGAGLGTFLPLVQGLMSNMKIEADSRSALLLTICAFTIIFIEEKKSKDVEQEDLLVKDSKSMLEELRMYGIGNGIVKKLVKLLKSIVSIFNLIGKHAGKIAETFIDMFSYSAILIPVMNGLSFIVGKYDLNIDTFIFNISGLVMGVGTIVAKQGVIAILNKLNLNKSKKQEIIADVDTSVVHKLSEFNPKDGEPINEQ